MPLHWRKRNSGQFKAAPPAVTNSSKAATECGAPSSAVQQHSPVRPAAGVAATAVPSPPATKRLKTKLERAATEKEHLTRQLNSLANQVAELQDALEEAKESTKATRARLNRTEQTAAEQLAVPCNTPLPRAAKRARQRAELKAAKTTKSRDRNVRNMSSDIDDYLTTSFKSEADMQEALVYLLSSKPKYTQALTSAVGKCPGVKLPIEKKVVKMIEEHWTAKLGLTVRLQCEVPQRPYQSLINILSKKYDPKTNKHSRVYLKPGLKMPSLGKYASKNAAIALGKKYFEDALPEALGGEQTGDAEELTAANGPRNNKARLKYQLEHKGCFEGMLRTVLDEDDEEFELALTVWRCLKDLYTELHTRLPTDNLKNRLEKYYKLRKKAGAYIQAVKDHGSAEDVHLYAHAAYHHFPLMLLRHGDLVDYSMQGLEHLNQLRKKTMHRHSNKRQKNARCKPCDGTNCVRVRYLEDPEGEELEEMLEA
ncbi:hypothetical protein CYMTET_25358 [Cymbomonas tetramitiformis]|uniref:Uncharacterized protein n=1 Tax=Cymbomonas tetramitiformis TaxID=36881 RepID=A0AAE0FUD1_9CHLO|nr:hypothetical protein CYMTET_25358 [Cymbomonas tetramitiformis]